MYSLQSEKAKKVEDFGISGSEIKSSRGLMHLRRGDDEMRVAELTSVLKLLQEHSRMCMQFQWFGRSILLCLIEYSKGRRRCSKHVVIHSFW